MKTSEILDKAADVVIERGWWREDFTPGQEYLSQHGLTFGNCPVCASGAVAVAAGHEPQFNRSRAEEGVYEALMALASRLTSEIAPDDEMDDLVSYVAEWNDEDGTTAEQVIAELRAAAASEREAGR